MERKLNRELAHDGGQLLKMLLARLSIKRTDWVHAYCYDGLKQDVPATKPRREGMISPEALERIKANQPCVVIGLGKLACEYLTGASLVSTRAGTFWENPLYGTVWITYSPDAALFDPTLVVSIYGVLAKAAAWAGIETQFNPSVRMFDWEANDYV